MNDTTPQIAQEMIDRFRAMSPQERLERGASLMNAGWEFAEIFVRKRFPEINELEFKRELVRYFYGDAMAAMIRS
jgi:hypothetical protein